MSLLSIVPLMLNNFVAPCYENNPRYEDESNREPAQSRWHDMVHENVNHRGQVGRLRWADHKSQSLYEKHPVTTVLAL
jgi:hypothetical protein